MPEQTTQPEKPVEPRPAPQRRIQVPTTLILIATTALCWTAMAVANVSDDRLNAFSGTMIALIIFFYFVVD